MELLVIPGGGEDMEKSQSPYTDGGNVKRKQPEWFGSVSKSETQDPALPHVDSHLREMKMKMHVHTETAHRCSQQPYYNGQT